jgi:hypothetical protein
MNRYFISWLKAFGRRRSVSATNNKPDSQNGIASLSIPGPQGARSIMGGNERKGLSSILLGTLCVFGSTHAHAYAEVVAQWHFDEAPGAAVAHDSIGSVDGILRGDAAFVAGGISGNAVRMTVAGNGLVNMGDNFSFTNTDFSVVAWIKTIPGQRTVDYASIAGRHDSGWGNGFFLSFDYQTGRASFYDSALGEARSTTDVDDGQWHQLAGVYHFGDVSEIYVDGSPADDSRPARTINANTVPFSVGGMRIAGTLESLYNGLVDELQLYDHPLTPSEVQYLFENPSQVVPEPSSVVLMLTAFLGLLASNCGSSRRRWFSDNQQQRVRAEGRCNLKRSLGAWITVLLFTSVGPAEAVGDTLGYADVVLDYFDSGAGPIPGPYGRVADASGDTGPGAPVSLDVVLGPEPSGGLDYLSLPTGSFVTVGFTDEVISDRPGFDFVVNERDGGELADVYAGPSPDSLAFLGTASGCTAFDLAGAGLSDPVQAVKVIGRDTGGSSPGFDLMNVRVRQVPTRAAPLKEGLIGYWQFDGDARDASGGGRDLRLMGGVGFAGGLFGEALDLHNNINQYATRPVDDAIYDFGSGDFTLQAWVNFNDTSHEQVLVEKYDPGVAPGWTLTMINDTGLDHVWHLSARPAVHLISDTQSIPTGVWHHVVARKYAEDFDIFYDGNNIAYGSGLDPVPDSPALLSVGVFNFPGGACYPLDGRIDEVAIWNRALTDQEIAALYNGGSGMPIPEPSSAVLAATACIGLLAFARRRTRRKRKQ